jgi:ubiquinone/menaquinone biosynthesis C-methylase UbiE
MSAPAEQLQAAYYTKTASAYDSVHAEENDYALGIINMLCDRLGLNTLLDVGSGTGRAVGFLRDRGKDARGVEPVPALIDEAERKGIPKGLIVQGTGYSLPFPDNSFDAVLECAVLHHVAEPSRVVEEMMRVARHAVFLSDSNRFGQGSSVARMLKLALDRLHLWNAAMFLQTKGKMFKVSEGDGVFYSYSVFDSYHRLHQWADTVWLIPSCLEKPAKSWLHPLLTSSGVLLCALKESTAPAKMGEMRPGRESSG